MTIASQLQRSSGWFLLRLADLSARLPARLVRSARHARCVDERRAPRSRCACGHGRIRAGAQFGDGARVGRASSRAAVWELAARVRQVIRQRLGVRAAPVLGRMGPQEARRRGPAFARVRPANARRSWRGLPSTACDTCEWTCRMHRRRPQSSRLAQTGRTARLGCRQSECAEECGSGGSSRRRRLEDHHHRRCSRPPGQIAVGKREHVRDGPGAVGRTRAHFRLPRSGESTDLTFARASRRARTRKSLPSKGTRRVARPLHMSPPGQQSANARAERRYRALRERSRRQSRGTG